MDPQRERETTGSRAEVRSQVYAYFRGHLVYNGLTPSFNPLKRKGKGFYAGGSGAQVEDLVGLACHKAGSPKKRGFIANSILYQMVPKVYPLQKSVEYSLTERNAAALTSLVPAEESPNNKTTKKERSIVWG